MSKKNQNIVILGAGESGVGAAILAKKNDWNIFVSDFGKITPAHQKSLNELNVDWEENTHSMKKILQADLVVKSPGIPESANVIVKLIEKGIKIISEIEFAGYYSKAKTICITGSNGKTTTSLLTYHILKNAGVSVGLAGNIGESFAKQVANENYDWYVLELSSFQLDGMFEFRADIAMLLNITPDHLDRYDYDINKYALSKFRVLQNQTANDWAIINKDDPIIQKELNVKEMN